jgi:hypothetical protein
MLDLQSKISRFLIFKIMSEKKVAHVENLKGL